MVTRSGQRSGLCMCLFENWVPQIPGFIIISFAKSLWDIHLHHFWTTYIRLRLPSCDFDFNFGFWSHLVTWLWVVLAYLFNDDFPKMRLRVHWGSGLAHALPKIILPVEASGKFVWKFRETREPPEIWWCIICSPIKTMRLLFCVSWFLDKPSKQTCLNGSSRH